MTDGQDHDDDLADALALVEAMRREDTEGFAAILKNMNSYGVVVALGKMLQVAADEVNATPEFFRRWGAQAMRQE